MINSAKVSVAHLMSEVKIHTTAFRPNYFELLKIALNSSEFVEITKFLFYSALGASYRANHIIMMIQWSLMLSSPMTEKGTYVLVP
jgi:hypothetical protein